MYACLAQLQHKKKREWFATVVVILTLVVAKPVDRLFVEWTSFELSHWVVVWSIVHTTLPPGCLRVFRLSRPPEDLLFSLLRQIQPQ